LLADVAPRHRTLSDDSHTGSDAFAVEGSIAFLALSLPAVSTIMLVRVSVCGPVTTKDWEH
jgi:hypothetical protein